MTLGAPTSIAQRTEDDTLTYLNKGTVRPPVGNRGTTLCKTRFSLHFNGCPCCSRTRGYGQILLRNYIMMYVSSRYTQMHNYTMTVSTRAHTHPHTHTHTHTHVQNIVPTGQFYSLYCKANNSPSVPDLVKTVVSLTFFDEPDKRVEFNHWQYWYNLQPNPNQRAFDIGECE